MQFLVVVAANSRSMFLNNAFHLASAAKRTEPT
jgi:hypothetical protein